MYLVYGMHHCLNVVTEPAPRPAALLIRAVEPIEGVGAMRAARARARMGHATMPDLRSPVPDARLAAGPGLVAACFSLDRGDTGADLCDPSSPLRLETRPAGEPAPEVAATPRIGIDRAGEPWTSVPWRLIVSGSPSLSRARA